MISESASEQSTMSPSPPTPKQTKLNNNKIKAHNKTNKRDHRELDEHQPHDKDGHPGSPTHSNIKKKSRSKLIVTQHHHHHHGGYGNDEDDDDDDNDSFDPTRSRQIINSDNNDHQPSEHNSLNSKVNKSKGYKNETNRPQKVSNDVDQTISHKNKCTNTTSTITNSTTTPVKKIKKEKKRYQELVIDGFTITAFRTWEDLQDEMNERISANIRRNAQNDDSAMPNTSCSGGTTSSLTATETTNFHSNQINATTAATITTTNTSILQLKQSPSSSGVASSNATTEVLRKNLTSQPNDTDRQVQPHQLTSSNNMDHHGDNRDYSHSDQQIQFKDRQSLLQKSLRQTNDHESEQQNHNKSHRREEYHKTVKMQSIRDASLVETRQHHSASSVNSSYPYGSDNIHEQYRSSRSGDADLRRSTKPLFDPQRASHVGQSSISNNYPRRSPSPPHPPPPPLPPPSSSQPAQQYFQQYHQLYQQMHNSAQHHHHQPHPHLQNAYLALMNHSQSTHLKGPGAAAAPPPPPPPQMPMPMPSPSSMMTPSPFNSPYTITDTIISRQTSIIPSTVLPTMPSSLEHLAKSRYARHPHLSALEHHMTPPAFGHHQHPSSYMPSPTERSFMEFARSYANASNMSSGYTNFMNHGAMPKGAMGAPGIYGQLERMTMDHQHRSMIQGFGAGGPGPFPGFNPAGRPPTISMFPPHYYP